MIKTEKLSHIINGRIRLDFRCLLTYYSTVRRIHSVRNKCADSKSWKSCDVGVFHFLEAQSFCQCKNAWVKRTKSKAACKILLEMLLSGVLFLFFVSGLTMYFTKGESPSTMHSVRGILSPLPFVPNLKIFWKRQIDWSQVVSSVISKYG